MALQPRWPKVATGGDYWTHPDRQTKISDRTEIDFRAEFPHVFRGNERRVKMSLDSANKYFH